MIDCGVSKTLKNKDEWLRKLKGEQMAMAYATDAYLIYVSVWISTSHPGEMEISLDQ